MGMANIGAVFPEGYGPSPMPEDWEGGQADWDIYWAGMCRCAQALDETMKGAPRRSVHGPGYDPRPPRRAVQKQRITRRAPASVTQLVYFIQASSGHIKIGVARNPLDRLGQLQISHPEPLTLLGYCTGGAELEAALHLESRADWVRGEWFRPSEKLLAKIRELTASK